MKSFTFIGILLLLLSCKNEEGSNRKIIEHNDAPRALKDNSFSLSKIARSTNENLIEELYEHLVEKDSGLASLENKIQNYDSRYENDYQDFQNFAIKSRSYYSDSKFMASKIKDSLLRKKIIKLIKNSEDKYSGTKSELVAILEKIKKEDSIFNDHYITLKIIKTLPLIQDFQKSHLPDKKRFQELLNKRRNINTKINSYINTK